MTKDQFIQKMVREAGAQILPLFGKARATHHKSASRSDAVTKADLMSEKIILAAIRKEYPSHGIISEESGHHDAEREYVWITDPLDGTFNFASGIPLWAVMAALSHKGEVILSAIYYPVTRELLFAKKGKGAFLNGKRIHCSPETRIRNTVGYVPGKGVKGHNFLRSLFKDIEGSNAIFNAYGCIAASTRFVSEGVRDYVVSFSGALHDFAPTSLMLREAGCVVTGMDGKPWSMASKGMVAANASLHRKLISLVKKA